MTTHLIVVVWNRTPGLSEGCPYVMLGHLKQHGMALNAWTHVLGYSRLFWFGFDPANLPTFL